MGIKLEDLEKLGLAYKTRQEAELDVTRLIVDDEFNSPNSGGEYRQNAIDRLIDLGKTHGYAFHSETNIVFEVVKQFLRLECPYCSRQMTFDGGGGNGLSVGISFKCPKCQSEGGVTIDSNGISFRPSEEIVNARAAMKGRLAKVKKTGPRSPGEERRLLRQQRSARRAAGK